MEKHINCDKKYVFVSPYVLLGSPNTEDMIIIHEKF